MCASCHGEAGEGTMGPRLIDTAHPEAELAQIIDTRMPVGNPDACDRACASSLAHYIKTNFTSAALACPSVQPSPRRLRLLSRREYSATIRDLLGFTTPSSSTPPAMTPACNLRRFAYAPNGRTLRSVHLAGTFNGWSPTAWPMTFSTTSNAWELEHEIANGSHQYKFVLDGNEWVRDPRNNDTVSDGFGGQNSVLNVQCETPPPTTPPPTGMTLGFDPAAMLPVESRPQGFLFDTNAEGAVVTAVHVSEHLRAARAITDAVRSRLRVIAGCESAPDARACADRFVQGFGMRAFRRPLTPAEATRYTTLITNARDLDTGLARALQATLVSPAFLYRSEMGTAQSDGSWKLTPWETASALSYTFWGTMPDAALFTAASDGTLATPAGVEREARRLLGDPRAREPVATFAMQWLGVETVANTPRSTTLFPEFTDAVRMAMLEETRRFVTHVIFDSTHRYEELFTSREGFVNETLARYYGITGVTGSEWRRVTFPDNRQGALLALGSVLTRYAHSDQTSPILRGVFVRKNLLCQDFPPPPPNAGGVPDVNPMATTRERFRQHTANAVCAGCHQYIDGVGFGFELFDAVGRFRTSENGQTIDHAGDIPDLEAIGTNTRLAFSTLPELARALSQSDAAQQCVARQFYRYARGYRDTADHRCATRYVLNRYRESNHDLRELMIAVVTSPDFTLRRAVTP
jgi:mono/diheme cytochrome c family protein